MCQTSTNNLRKNSPGTIFLKFQPFLLIILPDKIIKLAILPTEPFFCILTSTVQKLSLSDVDKILFYCKNHFSTQSKAQNKKETSTDKKGMRLNLSPDRNLFFLYI